MKTIDFSNDNTRRRVAIYTRSAVEDSDLTSSVEFQKEYCKDYVLFHPTWEFVGIYEDKGISGMSFDNRKGFSDMLEDCKAGKIDLIIVRNISRISRNIVDFLNVLRELKRLDPPVGIYSLAEGVYTLSENK